MIPNKLKKGDEIRVIAPSRSMKIIGNDSREIANKRFQDMGFQLTFGKNVEICDAFTSSSIEARIEDLHEAFADKNVKAIFTVIGGFNSNQLLTHIDYDLIKNNPKIFCGFSDITALLNAIYAKTGLVTYSGPHYSSFGMKYGFDYTMDYFKNMLMEEDPVEIFASDVWSNDPWFMDQEKRDFFKNSGMFTINEGTAEGKIIGGNLGTLSLLTGTEFMPKFDEDTILFLENDSSISGSVYILEFDRLLQSLIQQPGFENVKGIVLGRAEKNCDMSKEKWISLIQNKPELANIPVIANADFGHTTPIFTFPIGGHASLTAGKEAKLVIKG
ncbi:MAG: LD-carboxypeptidase [Clostridia bacterium]|nr:LD-carboxypeptidase [Clostridia bacterium]